MPRGRTYDPRSTSGLTSDQLRSVALIPGLPQTFLAILENLSGKTSGALKPGEVANSELVAELINIISDDYNNLSSEYLEAAQRISKLRLLYSCCSLLLPDLKSKQISSLLDLLCKLINAATRVDKILKLEETLHILKLLTIFVSSSAEKIGDRLGEILGYLFVLSGLHKSSEGISLVPTNLPHLHFTQTQDGPRRESSCTDTSGSEYSDQELICDVDARKRKEEGFIEKEALTAVDVLVKKCHKKDIVSYWFIFLPDKCYCPMQNGISSLLSHPCKKLRMASINILVDFLNHSHQFLALAQHQEKDTSYTSLSSALALSMLNLHKILLTRILEPLGNTEYVALLKLFAAVGENSSYSRLSPGLVDRMVNSLMELAERERNPVIQVAVLSVFVSLAHGPNIPDLKLVSREMFRFIRPRTLPVPQSLVSDNNVRYMSLQALSVLTLLDIQMFIKNATDVKSVIDISLKDSDPSIVLHTFRFIKNFAKYLTEVVNVLKAGVMV
ncbi:uncharacterized protein LOC111694846 [Eurytemora carolleeae]|uniref:uncharacterized protein LOC111694846 n=1 Tax=Eurytemora carolleeae TaxID=1294199 RepID=UPI000C78FEBF|nr:uncharacterized protein LOC111694846 [Eurytemora carolleeae]|eukprot:XP_023319652.1 uncharacterized protein LOC111694846 [Eurytemora affinis]